MHMTTTLTNLLNPPSRQCFPTRIAVCGEAVTAATRSFRCSFRFILLPERDTESGFAIPNPDYFQVNTLMLIRFQCRLIANATALAAARRTSDIWSSWTRRSIIARQTLALEVLLPSPYRYEKCSWGY